MVSKPPFGYLLFEHLIFHCIDDPSAILIQQPLIHYTVYTLTSPAVIQVKIVTISYRVDFGGVNMNYLKVENITILYSYEIDDPWPNKSWKIRR